MLGFHYREVPIREPIMCAIFSSSFIYYHRLSKLHSLEVYHGKGVGNYGVCFPHFSMQSWAKRNMVDSSTRLIKVKIIKVH